MKIAKSKFAADVPVADMLPELDKLSICPEADKWHKKHAGKKLRELVDAAVSDPEYRESWAAWSLLKIGRVPDTAITEKYIGKIKDPMIAFQLYIGLAWLSDEEDALLLAKFKGKLPAAEEELASGELKRKKV